MNPKVFAVIPVHNGIQHTLVLIRALTPIFPSNGKIVVVDDGSTDQTDAVLRSEHPEVVVLTGDGNLWWSGAMNVGSRYALDHDADYILFLNNDILLHPQFLEELLLGAKEFPKALISSKILSADEPWRVWSMGGVNVWSRGKHCMRGCFELDDGRWEKPIEADWLPGMSVLVPADVFRKGIWVDQAAFPQYCGDADFTMRARKAGFKLIVWPRSRIYNKIQSSGTTSQLLLGVSPFSLKLFIESFTSIKSSAAFRTFGKLIIRHAPFWAWIPTLGRFYSFYLLKCLQVFLGLPHLRSWMARKRYLKKIRQGEIRQERKEELDTDFV